MPWIIGNRLDGRSRGARRTRAGRTVPSCSLLALLWLAAGGPGSPAWAQDPSDAEIARVVRLVRQAERTMLAPPGRGLATAAVGEEVSPVDRVTAARRLLQSPESAKLNARIAAEVAKQDAQELLWGLKFGAGVSVSSTGRKGAIRDATVDSRGIVRVTREDTSSVGYLLEAHYFFTPDVAFLGMENLKGNWGIGPFVAVQAGSDKALSGIGFGLMLGFRRLITEPAPVSGLSWNIGVGALYDPSVKVLGAGMVPDQPLPAGEAAVRTTEVGSWGLLVLTSFNF